MTNRLHRQSPAIPVFLVFCLHFFNSSGLFAQPGFFNFTPPAVTTFPVGPLCSNSIANANPTPTVTSTINANITVSAFDPVQSGFPATDLWTAPTLNLVVYWHVEDDQAHTATFSFTVNFVDQTPPTLQNLPPPTASYGSIVQVPDPPNVTATDNCNLGPNPVSYTPTTPPDTCQAGTFTRTWKVTDAAGNTTIFTQTITITADNQPPTISFPPQNGSAPCNQLATAYPAWLAQQMSLFSAYDVSGIKSYTNNGPASFPPGCAVPLTVTFRATDNCNSFSTATAVFTTSDTQGPVILKVPVDTVGYCAVNGNQLVKLGEWIHQHAYLEAADACSGNPYLTYTMKKGATTLDSAGVVAAFLASYANGCGPQQVRGLVSIDFWVQDACGNPTLAGQATYRAIDTLPPVITGVNTTEQCGGGNDNATLQSWINAHGNATVTDECSPTTWTNFSYTTSNGQSGNGSFGSGPYPAVQAHNCNWWADVTFRATDECGNTGAKTLRFQIKDTLKPVIAGFPLTVTLYCPNPVPTLSPAFVTDNCDSSMAITYTFTTSDTSCGGAYTMHVTWSATDDCNNTGTAAQTVLVRDTVGPVFTLVPGPKTIRCDTFTLPPAPVLGLDIQAADNCSQAGNLSIQDVALQDPDPAVCAHYEYNIIRTFTVSDACGNTRTATQVISVIDGLGPAPGGVLDTTIVCDAQPVVTTPPAPVDACSGLTAVPVFVNDVVMNGICDDNYTITRNWQAVDVCGNTALIAQTIHIVDTVAPVWTGIPPDVTVECDAVPGIASVTATDNCDEMVAISFQESEIRSPDITDCSHWTNYTILREWTATDNCGNSRVHTQNISVQDNTGPVIVPVPLVMLPAEPGLCSATLGIPAPISVYDKCTALQTAIALRDTALLVNTSGGPNNTTPVDTIILQWSSPNMPPDAPALDPVTLKINLDIADAEGPTEYFRVYGENGFLIGQTNPNNPPIQCGNSVTILTTIPAAKLNDWLTDGQITLTLAPNGSGSGAINALASCSGGRVRAELSYQAAAPQLPVTLLYSLDGDTAEVFPPANGFSLDVGTHTVTYTAIDCAGNSSTATTTIEVKDLQPPVITPPAPDTFFVDPGTCLGIVKLPFPIISDNCDVSGHLVQASASLPVIFENDPNAGVIPKDIVLGIPGLIPNAISGGVLEIRHKGDNDNALGGEFFQVLDENDVPLTMTTSGSAAAQCSLFHETILNVSASTINQWAAGDKTASFKLIANDDAGSFVDFIDPCAALLPDKTDGISRVQAVLEYSFAVVTYEIRNSQGQLVKFGPLEGNETMDTLPPGNYTVKYLTTDVNGLEGSTNFTFTVRDTIRPAALCESQTIYVNPSGLPGDTYVLQPSEIDNGSNDNCPGNLTYQLSQTNFTCAQAGSNFTVTMIVTDASGNSSSCSAIVSVQTTVAQPSFDELCEGDTLKLYANPPGSASAYNWSGPDGFSSTLQNPLILSAQLKNEGTYCVTITGLTGCTSTGCVTVDFVNLAQPVISANKVVLCAGENVVLATPTYGTNAMYQWYEDVSPNPPALLQTTNLPVYTVNTPAVGIHRYFVKVLADNCSSFNSNLLSVTVNAIPPASVSPAVIDVCECEAISLNSTTPTLVGLTYMWMGPAGFNSTDADPLVTNCAMQIHKGIYKLVTKQNGCSSLPATVNVNVRTKPATPQLTGATQVCEGATVTLLTQYQASIDKYIWQSPSLDTTVTNINSLALNNVMVTDSGVWRVRTMQQGCYSDWSAPILVEVQAFPDVTGSANSPLCQGATLQLLATSNDAITSWTWSDQNGWVRYLQNPTRTPAVSGIYKVTGKTSFGCADSALVNVQVIDPPVITSITNTAPVCADGSDALLQAVVTSNNSPLTFIWRNPQGQLIQPLIPDVTAAQNGTYTLLVYDKYGCSSALGSTVINVSDPPVTPLLTTPPTVCAGADITITVSNANQYNNPAFTWLTPTGQQVTSTQPFLVVDSALVQNAGSYYAIVKVGDCVSDTSAPVNLVINPVPAVANASSNSPVCEGETLQLNTPFIPGATYSWIGPAGFTSQVRNPTRLNMIPAWSGNYNVQVTVNGCTSPYGEGVTVQVKSRPKLPVIAPPAPVEVCLDQAGSVLTLQVTSSSAETGSRYTWFYQGTMDTIGGPSFSLTLQTSDFDDFVPGWNSFYVIAYGQNGCNSLPSNPVQVDFDTIPKNSAFAGIDQDACITSPLKLGATNPAPAATGQWTQVTTLPIGMIVTPNNFMTEVTGAQPGQVYQFAWTLSNGGCKNYNTDTVSITTFAPELPQVIDEVKDTCYAKAVQLHAVQGTTTPGYWSQEPGQAILGIYFHDPADPNTIVDSLTPGNTYYFFWNLDNGACGITSQRVTVINYGSVAKGGEDKILCSNDSCTTLVADPLPGGETGQWSSDDPNLIITTPNLNTTSVCNLKRGANTLYWTTNGGRCGPQSRDTVMIVYDLLPTAVPDTFAVGFGQTINFNVLQNDIVPQQPGITVDQEPAYESTFTDKGMGQFTYQPSPTAPGQDQMIYKICNLVCPTPACSTATVILLIGEPGDCLPYNVITPNNDGVNDFFFVPCLDRGEVLDNEVTIFNQWGDVVYHAQPYDNNDPWRGDYNGQALPVGTYFYVIKFNGQAEPQSGFLQLTR